MSRAAYQSRKSDVSRRKKTVISSHRLENFLAKTEQIRVEATEKLDASLRGRMGQYLTPTSVAGYMASLFRCDANSIRLLEAGAGVGSLIAAFVSEICRRGRLPERIDVTAYEIEPILISGLNETIGLCREVCKEVGIRFSAAVFDGDFIGSAVSSLAGDLFDVRQTNRFNAAILNPPYHKIRSNSAARLALRRGGIEASNLYAGFVGLSVKMLEPSGEMVAITPRSFCNGPYFKPFRELLLENTDFRHIHVFNSRDKAFCGDDVLQENIIYRLVKRSQSPKVIISSSDSAGDRSVERGVNFADVVLPNDPNKFVHLSVSDSDRRIASNMRQLGSSLENLGITVSTGRVVDFRAKQHLRDEPEPGTVPLIYPCHFNGGYVDWPKNGSKKPNAIVACLDTEDLLVPEGYYVLVRRFSSKEERKRIVAVVYNPKKVSAKLVGFENHVNYFHQNGRGLSKAIAQGLAVYLSSTLVDNYFRQFNGHTQVNATDLRSLLYPSLEQLETLGKTYVEMITDQDKVDKLVEATVC
jgi:adenine-specific DNA-methyltransferase